MLGLASVDAMPMDCFLGVGSGSVEHMVLLVGIIDDEDEMEELVVLVVVAVVGGSQEDARICKLAGARKTGKMNNCVNNNVIILL